jgi:hypothetical protein
MIVIKMENVFARVFLDASRKRDFAADSSL